MHAALSLLQAAFVEQHFDSDFNFCALEEDPVTKKVLVIVLLASQSSHLSTLVSVPQWVEEIAAPPAMGLALGPIAAQMFNLYCFGPMAIIHKSFLGLMDLFGCLICWLSCLRAPPLTAALLYSLHLIASICVLAMMQAIKKIMSNVKPKDMGALLAGPGSAEEEPKTVAAFRDLLDKMFALDPDKRITVSQALSHPFISGR